MGFWWRDCIRESSYKSFNPALAGYNKLTICWNTLKINNRPRTNGPTSENLLCLGNRQERTLWFAPQRLDVDYHKYYSLNTAHLRESFYQQKFFGSYLAGLIEGDGHFYIQTDENRKLNRKHSPEIVITFDKKNLPWIKKIFSIIGHGYIRGADANNNTGKFIITNHQGLIKTVNLINGKFRTPKIEALHRLINWLNKDQNLNLPKLALDQSSLVSNAWLVGFIDADGQFLMNCNKPTINQNLKVKNESFSCRFQLEQREIYSRGGSYEDIMNEIAILFNVSLRTIKRKKSFLWCVSVESQKNLGLVKNYFDLYPLMSSKYLDYQDWLLAYYIILDKSHLTKTGKEK